MGDTLGNPLVKGTDGGINVKWNELLAATNTLSIAPLPGTSGGEAVYVSGRFFGASFSPKSASDAFNTTQEDINTAFENGNLLLLGLKYVAAEQFTNDMTTLATIDDVLHAFGFEDDDTSLPIPLNHVVSSFKDKTVNTVLPTFRIDVTESKKNGVWLASDDFDDLEVITVLSLQMQIPQELKLSEKVVSALKTTFGIEVSTLNFPREKLPRVRLKNRTRAFKDEGGNIIIDSSFEFNVQLPVKGFILSLTVDCSGELRFAVLDDPAVSGNIFHKIKALLTDLPEETTALTADDDDDDGDQGPGFVSEPVLWAMTVTKNSNGFSWSIGFIVTMHLLDLTSRVALTYDSASGTFRGMLLLKNMTYSRLLPDFIDANEIPNGVNLPDELDLKQSSYFKTTLPEGVPTAITEAFISFRKKKKGANAASLSLSTTIESSSYTEPDPDGIPNPIDWNRVTFDFVKEGSSLAMSIYTTFQLNPPSINKRYLPGTLAVNLLYSKESVQGTVTSATSTWQFSASARNIQMGAIAEWFDPEMSNEVLDLLGNIAIKQLDLAYTYETKKASTFLISGTVLLGPMKLSLYYQYAKSGSVNPAIQNVKPNTNGTVPGPVTVPSGQKTAWQLDAYLDPTDDELTVGDVIDAILDDPSENSDNIPDFVRKVRIKCNQNQGHLISLKVRKIPGAIARLVFILDVNTSDIQFSFVQISGAGSASQSKRILRVSVSRLPLLPNLPVVGELPQPFDQLQYMWVISGSLTKLEVQMINQHLTPASMLYFKPISTDLDAAVLLKGHHFIVVNDGVAILDHVCSPDTKRKSGSKQSIAATNAGTSRPTQVSPTTPSKGALRKQTKLLDISALSLEYKDSKLWIYVDATLALGPLAFTLIGFGVGFAIKELTLDNLLSVVNTLEFQLRGMSIAFDKPPILIAGVFEVVTVKSPVKIEKCYRGGICLQIPPYAFVAVGEYAEVTEVEGEGDNMKSRTYKSVFIFAKLDGPLLDLAFVQIKGVRAGFGFNNLIRSPAVQELSQFPLISDTSAAGTGNNPMLILNNMRKGNNPWIQTKEDNYWLAFGFTVSAFDLLNATCVALVSFRDNGPIFSIFGVAICELPPNTPEGMKLAYVEIIMNAELDFAQDCFKVQACLSPASYIYCPQAHLQGGFAMYTFFGRSAFAGDWVFTIGGYHRKFQAPLHYPIVDRLGLNFSIGIVSIRGLGYFAITPKAMMAGAVLHCELCVGPVYAYLDAGFDALIIFHPLHYWIDMHVDVGVQCRVPLGLITVKISVHIGAELHIEGPEFGGDAYVDFWFFSFHIPFGASSAPGSALNILEFYQLCLRGGPKDEPNNPRTTIDDGLNVRLKFNLEDGVFTLPPVDTQKDSAGKEVAKQNPSSEGPGAKWFVKGGSFKFRISTVFAISSAWLETPQSAAAAVEASKTPTDAKDSKDSKVSPPMTNLYQQADFTDPEDKGKKLLQKVTPEPPNTGNVYSLPMKVSVPIDSPFYVGITSDGGGETNVSEGWKVGYVVKAMPATLWANPASPPNPLSADKGTVDERMELTFSTPDPILAKSKIPQFNASDMARACAGLAAIPETDKVGDKRPIQLVYLPAPLEEATVNNAAADWAKFQKTWEDTAKDKADTAEALVNTCIQLLGWDKPSVDVMQLVEQATDGENNTPWLIDAAFPKRLVTGTKGTNVDVEDGFENYYLELPRLSTLEA